MPVTPVSCHLKGLALAVRRVLDCELQQLSQFRPSCTERDFTARLL